MRKNYDFAKKEVRSLDMRATLQEIVDYVDSNPAKAHAADCALLARQCLARVDASIKAAATKVLKKQAKVFKKLAKDD